jgi:hypothetical protein
MIFFTDEIPYTEEMLITEFNMEQRASILKLALRTFEQFNMIQIIDNVFCISSWEKYQNIEALQKIREQTRLRVAKHRDTQKQISCNVTVTENVTQCNATDIEEDKEIDKDKDIVLKKNSHFVPPSLQEVQAYCKERNNGIDAEAFIAFYESKGWKVGNQPMKNWKSAIVTWEKRDKKPGSPEKPKQNKFNQYPQRQYSSTDFSEMERKLLNKGYRRSYDYQMYSSRKNIT